MDAIIKRVLNELETKPHTNVEQLDKHKEILKLVDNSTHKDAQIESVMQQAKHAKSNHEILNKEKN